MPVRQRDLGRVLVIGAAGFLGAAVAKHLRARGVQIVAADIAKRCDGLGEMACCDVSEFSQVEALVGEGHFATILHCGGISGPMVRTDDPLAIWRINALGSANVLEAARRAGVARPVLCSAIDVYGSRHGGVADETMAPDPDTVYAASKVAAEEAVLGYRREHGLDAIALRLAWIYGPGRRTPTELETLLRNAIAGRRTVLTGHPKDPSHYLFIDDAVQGLVRAAAAAETRSAIFNLTSGKTASLARAVEIVRAVLPELDVGFAQTEWTPKGPCGFSQALAEAELGFERQVQFPEGVRRYVEALRSPAETA
ncbi:NAD-dependent epimerase/dehydratase family protein [Jiella sp. M17.18]|uniref:NAD-dependent epimerase/dehydratase family protein n=1 Tax=Jiella sp. M17.18 TaxID=3234247 RepID=UPI0034DFAA59